MFYTPMSGRVNPVFYLVTKQRNLPLVGSGAPQPRKRRLTPKKAAPRIPDSGASHPRRRRPALARKERRPTLEHNGKTAGAERRDALTS